MAAGWVKQLASGRARLDVRNGASRQVGAIPKSFRPDLDKVCQPCRNSIIISIILLYVVPKKSQVPISSSSVYTVHVLVILKKKPQGEALNLMAALVVRRNVRMRESHVTSEEDDVDNRPIFLKTFPAESTITKDLKLGVLLGR